jgi:hypothetical protein
MFDRALVAAGPRLLYGIPAPLLLTFTIAMLPGWNSFAVMAVVVLGAAITCTKARRCGALDLLKVQPTALY